MWGYVWGYSYGMTEEDSAEMFAAIDAAYAQALADHKSGACRDSEWSCSYCEQES